MATKQQGHHAHPIRPSLQGRKQGGEEGTNSKRRKESKEKRKQETHSSEKTFRCVSETK